MNLIIFKIWIAKKFKKDNIIIWKWNIIILDFKYN